MSTNDDTKTQLANFGLAIDAGIEASRQNFEGWTARDQQVAHFAAKEALRAWVLLMRPA